MQKTSQIKKITVVGLMTALAYICMFVFRIKVGFLTFDAKDAVIAITSLTYGPLWGGITAVLVPLLEMFTVSETGWYGFVMNSLSSVTFALVCGYLYKCKRNYWGAILAVSIAAASVVVVMLAANCVITPVYAQMVGFPFDLSKSLPTLLLPFNTIKAALNAALTLALYKPFTTALRQARLLPKLAMNYQMKGKSVVLLVVSVLIIVASVAIMLVLLNGEFEFVRK